MKTTPAQFRNIKQRLDNGDFVETEALGHWVKDATVIYQQLLATPVYFLVARDLLTTAQMAEGYLRERKVTGYKHD